MKLMFVFQILWIAIFVVETEKIPFNKLGRVDPNSEPRQDVVTLNKIEDKHQSTRRGRRNLLKGTHNKVKQHELLAALSAASSVKNDKEETRLPDLVTLDHSKREAMTSSLDDLHPNMPRGISAPIPPYMIAIYDKFANTDLNHASIIRSFQNKETASGENGLRSGTILHTEDQQRAHFDYYNMLFNLTIPPGEYVTEAELRIFINTKNVNHKGDISTLTIYEDMTSHTKMVRSSTLHIPGSGWQSLDLTDFVRLVVKRSHSKATKKTRRLFLPLRLQIHTQTVLELDSESHFDVAYNNNMYEPLLVVFTEENTKDNIQKTNEPKQDIDEANDRRSDDIYSTATEKPGNSATMRRRKRDLAERRSLCRRRPMQVVFGDIGWDEWVIAPRRYEAFKCSGKCTFPLTDHWNPTTHSIIQTLVHLRDPRHIDNPCCVPTELGPISMLYLDEANVLTYKYRYEGMVVNQCGCH